MKQPVTEVAYLVDFTDGVQERPFGKMCTGL